MMERKKMISQTLTTLPAGMILELHCLPGRTMTTSGTLATFQKMGSRAVPTSHLTMRKMALVIVRLQRLLLHPCLQQAFRTG